jgi:hypothetical protein
MRRLTAFLFACFVAASAMAQAIPFVPVWPPANLTVTGTAQDITLPTAAAPAGFASFPTYGVKQYLVTVSGTADVFLRCDSTTATTSNATRFVPNTMTVWSLPDSILVCSAIAATTGSSVSITRGLGG